MELDFEKDLWLSTVPLVAVDIHGHPKAIASGCFIQYAGKKLLLSVQHATGDGNIWSIQQQFVPGKGTEIYRLGGMHFLKRGNIDSLDFKNVDFSYVVIPESTLAKRQEIDLSTGTIISEEDIAVLNTTLKEKPDSTLNYGFSGLVKGNVEHHPKTILLGTEPRVYTGLKYLRTDGDYHYFKLPSAHPGHEHFRGCSGAPIISSTGELIALVCGGEEETDEIRGISLQAYKLPIDLLIGGHI